MALEQEIQRSCQGQDGEDDEDGKLHLSGEVLALAASTWIRAVLSIVKQERALLRSKHP
jgi:hypothetical protein